MSTSPPPDPGPPAPLRCPTCHAPLRREPTREVCPAGHSFDRAKEGYVNLLLSHQRRSKEPGDSPEMVRARRAILGSGAYDALASGLAAAVPAAADVVVDVGCGEGTYTRRLHRGGRRVVGVDISKTAVRLAAKADPAGEYVVASAFDLPVLDAEVDAAVVCFGPVVDVELARVLRSDGTVVVAHPGPDHLYALRAVVYDHPEPHTAKDPLRHAVDLFDLVDRREVRSSLRLGSADEVQALLLMTPYVWKLDDASRERLAATASLATELHVVLSTYRLRQGASPVATGRESSDDHSDHEPT